MRRVSLDTIGLPPTEAEVREFIMPFAGVTTRELRLSAEIKQLLNPPPEPKVGSSPIAEAEEFAKEAIDLGTRDQLAANRHDWPREQQDRKPAHAPAWTPQSLCPAPTM